MISIVSLLYWPAKAGGAPPVQQMGEMLAKYGAQVTVLTARPSYPELEVFPEYRDGSRDRETHNGVSIIRLPVAPQKAGGAYSRFSRPKVHMPLGARSHLIKRPRADITIAICPSILAVGAMRLAVSRRTRRIAIVHDIQSGLGSSRSA
ncbi:MAG: glycosyltransferase [Thiohalocapsa sp.]